MLLGSRVQDCIEDVPREPNTPLIKEYGLNYIGLHIMI